MSAVEENITAIPGLKPYPRLAPQLWQKAIHHRFDTVRAAAPIIPYDNGSRFIFFSDCHRGDGSRSDAFAPNEPIYFRALSHYHQAGYTYIEVGDGDELWQHRNFGRIREAHGRVFDLFHDFNRAGHLHLLHGNHDLQDRLGNPAEKDGIPTREGLLLRHRLTGRQIFVVHGHQADNFSERYYFMARFTIRHFWRRFLLYGLVTPAPKPDPVRQQQLIQQRGLDWILAQQNKVAQRIAQWARMNDQPVICGHTHLAVCANGGGTPYFNTGSCVNPGYITGLELVNGRLSLVRWSSGGRAYL